MAARSPHKTFEAFFHAHHLAVLRYARRRVDETVAWDVVSETFLAAWRTWDRRPEATGEALPWLYAIAGNAVRNQNRATARAGRLAARLSSAGLAEADSRGSAPDAVAEATADRDLALRALAQLPGADREILMLAAWEQLDLTGLATALSISPGAAKVRLHRARRRLRALIDPPSDAPAWAAAVPTGGGAP